MVGVDIDIAKWTVEKTFQGRMAEKAEVWVRNRPGSTRSTNALGSK